MNAPSQKTVKRLFALSRNRCAFPGCDVPIAEESGTVTGHICHICSLKPDGPRYDPAQTDEQRHGFSNLILMCARHHGIVDSEPDRYTAASLLEMKRQHERLGEIEITPQAALAAQKLLGQYRTLVIHDVAGHVAVNSPGAVQADTVNIRTGRRTVKVQPPPGAIASDLTMRNYVKYLIDRYNEWQKIDKEKTGRYKYMAIYDGVKREFKCKWDMVPREKFGELVAHLQRRIDDTRVGRIRKKRGEKSYDSFGDYATP